MKKSLVFPSILLIVSILFSSIIPIEAVYQLVGSEGEDQFIVEGDYIDFGFTAYGEMVTDQDPYDIDSDYGVGLTYKDDVFTAEHIACPTITGGPPLGGTIYIPIEGWQLFWKWKEGTPAWSIDPYWHISMAIYGNHSAPFNMMARLDVKRPEELCLSSPGVRIITDDASFFEAEVTLYTYNETLLTAFGLDPVVFEITVRYVFNKALKKVTSHWKVEYLKLEYMPVDVVFRRMTNFAVDSKFQDNQKQSFAVFFEHASDGIGNWSADQSLALVWTNNSMFNWDPIDAPHHVGFIAYDPVCHNYDTDNWNYFIFNIHTQWENPFARKVWLARNSLARKYQLQPMTAELAEYDSDHYAAANLLMGQWNFTLSCHTPERFWESNTTYGITDCPVTFGYVDNKYSGYWGPGGGDVLVEITAILNAKSVKSATDKGNVAFTSPETIVDLTAIDEASLPSQGKPALNFPYGFFSFRITNLTLGQTVTVTITFPSAVPVGTQYWKYHASEGGWIQIPMGSDDGDNVITITLEDGGLGDDDGEVNGIIVDQGGPGNPGGGRGAVGGEVFTADKLAILTPYLIMAIVLVTTATVIIKKRRN